jgi:hypothetical protein
VPTGSTHFPCPHHVVRKRNFFPSGPSNLIICFVSSEADTSSAVPIAVGSTLPLAGTWKLNPSCSARLPVREAVIFGSAWLDRLFLRALLLLRVCRKRMKSISCDLPRRVPWNFDFRTATSLREYPAPLKFLVKSGV